LDEKPVKNCHVLTNKKLDKTGDITEHSPQQSPRCLYTRKLDLLVVVTLKGRLPLGGGSWQITETPDIAARCTV
jgi:hypothetical protein